MTTTVVNLYKEPYDVYVGRFNPTVLDMGQMNGYYGNPFTLKPKASQEEREECLKLYKQHFYDRLETDPHFKRNIETLRGKKLGCYCKPKLCHADIIAEYLNANEEAV